MIILTYEEIQLISIYIYYIYIYIYINKVSKVGDRN